MPTDLRLVETPIYLQASEKDHVAPLESVFKATKHPSGLGRGWDVRLPDLPFLVRHPICDRFLRALHMIALGSRPSNYPCIP